jgi:hypothetical protein
MMGDENTVDTDNEEIEEVSDSEIEAETDYEEFTIEDMIDDILSGDNTEAKEKFNAIVSSKLADALDQKKIDIASNLYSDGTAAEEEQE